MNTLSKLGFINPVMSNNRRRCVFWQVWQELSGKIGSKNWPGHNHFPARGARPKEYGTLAASGQPHALPVCLPNTSMALARGEGAIYNRYIGDSPLFIMVMICLLIRSLF